MNAYASARAANLAKMGRHGDTHLLHVSTGELRDLARLGHLSKNPETGLPEAFGLGSITHAISGAVSGIGNALSGGGGRFGRLLSTVAAPIQSTASAVTHPVDTVQNFGANLRTNPLGTFTGGLGGSALGTGGFDYYGRTPQQNQAGLGGLERMIGTGTAGLAGGPLVGAGVKAGINALGGGAAGLPQQRVPMAAAGTGAGSDAPWGVNPTDPNTMRALDASGGGSAVGGLLGAGANLLGSNEALKSYEEAQHNAENAGRFTPYNVYSGMGSTTFGPNSVTGSLSPQYQGIQGSLLSNASGALGAGAQDPQTLSNNYYGMLQKQASPYEAQDRANALAQLQATGTTGLGVGGDALSGPSNPLYSSLLRAQSDAALQRQIQAQTMAQTVANSTQQRGLNYLNAGAGLDQLGLQNAQLGGQLGAIQTQGALGGAKLAQPGILGQGATKGGALGGLGSSLGGIGGLLSKFGGSLGNLANSSTLFGSGGLSGMIGGVGSNVGSWFGGGPQQVGLPGQDILEDPTQLQDAGSGIFDQLGNASDWWA